MHNNAFYCSHDGMEQIYQNLIEKIFFIHKNTLNCLWIQINSLHLNLVFKSIRQIYTVYCSKIYDHELYIVE